MSDIFFEVALAMCCFIIPAEPASCGGSLRITFCCIFSGIIIKRHPEGGSVLKGIIYLNRNVEFVQISFYETDLSG